MYSGMIIDFEVLSNFCAACAITRKKETATYDDWYKTVHSGKCQANFEGLSGAMESEGAVRMWQRSEVKGYRYVTFLSDGDSSSYKTVCKMNNGNGPYASQCCERGVCQPCAKTNGYTAEKVEGRTERGENN